MVAPNIEPMLKINSLRQKILTKSVYLSHLAAQLLTNPVEPSPFLVKTFLRNIGNLRIILKNYDKSFRKDSMSFQNPSPSSLVPVPQWRQHENQGGKLFNPWKQSKKENKWKPLENQGHQRDNLEKQPDNYRKQPENQGNNPDNMRKKLEIPWKEDEKNRELPVLDNQGENQVKQLDDLGKQLENKGKHSENYGKQSENHRKQPENSQGNQPQNQGKHPGIQGNKPENLWEQPESRESARKPREIARKRRETAPIRVEKSRNSRETP